MLHRLKFKLTLFTTLFAPVGYNSVLANFTPPPPSISKYNELGLDDSYWRIESGEAGKGTKFSKDSEIFKRLYYIRVKRGENYRVEVGDEFSPVLDVDLDGGGSTLSFHGYNLEESVRIMNVLSVGGYNSILDFSGGSTKLFINDLIIKDGAELTISGFVSSRYDGFFVKKTSRHLGDALAKIRIWDRSDVGVRDYNNDYWEIGVGAGFRPLPVPEPTTYGAAFSVAALGLWAFRCRKRRVPLTSGFRT